VTFYTIGYRVARSAEEIIYQIVIEKGHWISIAARCCRFYL